MPITYNPTFDYLNSQVGPFQAAMMVAQNARDIEKSLGNRITTSAALDFAARGELPDPKDYPDLRLSRVKRYTDYILDPEIKSAVIASYEESLKNNNLIYIYKTVEDKPRQARIRVLMNILWDSRPHKR